MTDPTPSAPRVLVVDDDALNRRILASSLGSEGLEVVTAADGGEALGLLLQGSFDLVLLDVLMPNVGGLDVLQHLKADEHLRHLPVIMVSAMEEIEQVVTCIEMGADDYLSKPFNPALLRARVRASIDRKRLHDLEHEHRDLLRRLFDHHVGSEVARHAVETDVDFTGEVLQASALFVDVVGSTGLAQRLHPTELIAALNAFFDTVVDVVTAEGGLINKFAGDAALCIFGAPTERPDHATRALRAARSLASALRPREGDPLALDVGIGVSAGAVVAGNVGARDRYEYTVLGDPVNEAARLTSEAKDLPSRVLASGAALQRADREEQRAWGAPFAVDLRGRDGTTLAFTTAADDAVQAPPLAVAQPDT